ncbi:MULTISPECIES: hypothetical protein [unclassified Phycicoccus]|uniref:hypothetical protein n=1 Tax=unclassified Phycicoccus TaxID=2637926 RepID=UPI000710FF99|nr:MULTISPECIES: hypothetical protein [unclassified Phycicoccus]KRF23226.1 hypothetical protein ASG95_00410 [Phycicoccus sp. Soil803]
MTRRNQRTHRFPWLEATLWVLDGNQRARRFYEHHGWRSDGAAKVDWCGDVRLDEVRYRHSLAAEPA